MTTRLTLAYDAETEAKAEIKRAEQELKDACDIKEGDYVEIVAKPVKHRVVGDYTGEHHGNAAIGEVTQIANINVRRDGTLSFTTTWRDLRGMLWCWEREEVKKVPTPKITVKA